MESTKLECEVTFNVVKLHETIEKNYVRVLNIGVVHDGNFLLFGSKALPRSESTMPVFSAPSIRRTTLLYLPPRCECHQGLPRARGSTLVLWKSRLRMTPCTRRHSPDQVMPVLLLARCGDRNFHRTRQLFISEGISPARAPLMDPSAYGILPP